MNQGESAAECPSNEIVVKPGDRWERGLLTVLLITIWMIGGISFASEVLSKNLDSLLVPFFLFVVLWSTANILLIFLLAWIIFGLKVAVMSDAELTIVHKIGPVKISKSKIFAVDHVEDMRIEERTYKSRGNVALKHVISFDYYGRRQSLFSHLSKEQAELLLSGPLNKFVRNRRKC